MNGRTDRHIHQRYAQRCLDRYTEADDLWTNIQLRQITVKRPKNSEIVSTASNEKIIMKRNLNVQVKVDNVHTAVVCCSSWHKVMWWNNILIDITWANHQHSWHIQAETAQSKCHFVQLIHNILRTFISYLFRIPPITCHYLDSATCPHLNLTALSSLMKPWGPCLASVTALLPRPPEVKKSLDWLIDWAGFNVSTNTV